MRKTIALSFAIALVLGMAQCKKVETIDPDGGEKIQITLDVDGGRHVINPSSSGAVNYASGDVIYVGDGSRFIGTLTHNGTKFVGEVNTPVGDKLHFYFIGGFEPSATPVQGSTTSFTVNISDQSSKLLVLSYENVEYVQGQRNYTCMLKNKCALVEFKLTTGTSDAVTLNSVPTIATVNFSTPGITSTGTTGNITLNSESTTSKWAILLPMATATNTNVTIGSNNYDVEVPVITANDYLHDETAIAINNAAPAADYVFSVSSTQTVHFSPGNLQYKYDEGWRFAQHQYDYIDFWYEDEWVDLFGWGTWGSGMNPLNQSTNVNDYPWSSDFQGTLDGHNDWRTLTKDEWQYILDNSTHGMARVNGVYGIVILPDNSTLSISNEYTASNWTNDMEAYGAVFLPAAGSRYGTDPVVCGGSTGEYWSSTAHETNPYRAYYLYFSDEEDEVTVEADGRRVACSVRLVR